MKFLVLNEPPFAEWYVRWHERTIDDVISYFLFD